MAKKYFLGIFWNVEEKIPSNSKFSQIEIWIFKNFAWRKKSLDFFSKLFFDLEKNIFSELEKNFEHSFDVEIHDLSIYEGPRVILELLPALKGSQTSLPYFLFKT